MSHAQIFHYGIPKGFVLKTKLTKDFSYLDKSHDYTFKVLEAVLGHNIYDTDWFILREVDIADKPPQLKEESLYNVTRKSDGTFSIAESEPSGEDDVEVTKKKDQEGQEEGKQGQGKDGAGEKGGKEEGSGEDEKEQEEGGKGKQSGEGNGQGHVEEEEPERKNQ